MAAMNSLAVRTSTEASMWKVMLMRVEISSSIAAAVRRPDEKIALPLCPWVRTFAYPSDSSSARRGRASRFSWHGRR